MQLTLPVLAAMVVSTVAHPFVQGGLAPVDADPEPLYGSVHALCIGVGDYDSALVPDLQHAESDALGVGGVLQEVYGYQVRSLVGSQATRAAILAAIDAYDAMLGADDALVVYFAGHGAEVLVDPRERRRSGFLIPFDAQLDLEDRLDPAEWRAQALEMPALVERLVRLPARQVLLLADACHSGYLGRAPRGGVELTDDLYELIGRRSRSVVTAGTEGQAALEDSSLGSGVFTHYLVEELRKGRAQSVLEVFLAVRRAVQRDSRRAMLPLFRELAPEHGEFVFVPRGVSSPHEAVAEAGERRLRMRGLGVSLEDVFAVFDAWEYRFGEEADVLERAWLVDVKRFEQNASLASPLALLCLHYAHQKGLGVAPDADLALRYARLAADTGHVAGDYALYRCYRLGVGVPVNELAAERLLAGALEERFPPAVLASRIAELERGSLEDPAAVLEDLEWLMGLGSSTAALRFARCHMGIAPVPLDLPRAVEALETAADEGLPTAARELFLIHSRGGPGVTPDWPRALSYLQQAARAGHPDALFDLAQLLHQEGAYGWTKRYGVEQDLDGARRCAELARAQGHTPAMLMLSRMYVFGHGVEEDYARARAYCEEALRANDVEALIEKGTWLLDGVVLQRDEEQAYFLFVQASERGSAAGHYWRARCLEDVRGVPYEGGFPRAEMREFFRVHAMHWYVQAARLGYEEAKARLAEPRFRTTLRELRAKYPDSAAWYEQAFPR